MAISKIILNGVTQMDLTSDTVAASNLIAPNTAHGADGEAITGTASGGGNDFIITLSYNSNTETWDPDCTWAELSAARTAGKNIIVDVDDSTNLVTAGGYVIDSTTFFYYIHKLNVLENNNVTTVCITEEDYDFTNTGAIKTYTYTYYDTSDANALPSQVSNGQIFYASTGRAVGTATSGGSSMNVQAYAGYDSVNVNTYTDTDVTLTVAKSGTYTISWMGWRNTTSGTSGSQLYKNGTAVGTANTSFLNSYGQSVTLTGQSLNQGDVLVVRARARNASYYMGVGNLIIIQTA